MGSMCDLNMRAETDNFILDFGLESSNNTDRKHHDSHAQCNAGYGKYNDRTREAIRELVSSHDSSSYEKICLQFLVHDSDAKVHKATIL